MLCKASAKNIPLSSESVDLIFTDPPYLNKYLITFKWLADEAVRILKPGGFVLAMCGGYYLNEIFRMFDNSGLLYYWKYEIECTGKSAGTVWRNGKPISTRAKSILAYSKGKSASRTASLGLVVCNGPSKQFHHWGQDVASARYMIDCFSKVGDLVVDPFCGGCTTAIACRLIGREFIGIDLDSNALLVTRDRLLNGEYPSQFALWK